MYLISQKRYIFGILMIEGIAHTTSQSEGNGNLTSINYSLQTREQPTPEEFY